MTTKKTLEAVIAGGVLVVSINANAQTSACTDGSVAATIATGGFVVKSVVPKCSANVYLSVKDNTASFSAKSNSKKGRTEFGSNSDGGGITICTTFATHAAPTASDIGC